ncbi:MAG: SCP2 sterol-binding domain-containing protein [Lachnospiraceae bacterium]|nr:SCP2 sterol-binding domain-containing protein [Lachnospiraceae bacterium]
MTYKEIVDKVRETFEYADARNIFEHIAIQVNVTGEGSGVMYLEVAQRQVTVEPYDYYDRDGLVTIDSNVLLDICSGKYSLRHAYKHGMLTYQGNERKWLACLNNITLN